MEFRGGRECGFQVGYNPYLTSATQTCAPAPHGLDGSDSAKFLTVGEFRATLLHHCAPQELDHAFRHMMKE